MASQWGRKETIIWPPHVPVACYSAFAGAILCLCLWSWYTLAHSLTPLQRTYITDYARSQIGATFKHKGEYRLVYLAGGKLKLRLALPVDLTLGTTPLPDSKTMPIVLSELAQAQGYQRFFRGAEQKVDDAFMHRWLRGAVYHNEAFFSLFSTACIGAGAALAVMLCLAVPKDLKRFKEQKYGRVLRGPTMLTPKQFNKNPTPPPALGATHLGHAALAFTALDLAGLVATALAFTNPDVAALELAYTRRPSPGSRLATPRKDKQKSRPSPTQGIGFKTTEMKAMMRIPLQKEAQHFQLMGDTGVGKTQLIMQIMRQIRDRGDSAIVYDPACEYVQRFYDEGRGDVILNPLDARCPYWGPAQEMGSNAEADAIAASLYSPATDAKDEFFHQTPAQIFAHLLKRGPTPQQLADWMADANQLEELVKGTEMSFYIDKKAGPQRAGVLSSLGIVAKCFRLLPDQTQSKRTWNARTWATERRGWVFITSRPPERETLRPLHSLWIDLLVMRLLSAPQPGQKQVWFVVDELASLQKLPQLHTAITENRKSKNPLVLGFQGKAQLEVIYGHLAEVMLSQPATKIFMKTAEPKAAEWISEAIGKVEIERVKETKFDGSRSGKNFSLDRQIEPLVMGSEITGLDDRHAYLKLGNNVARFDFEYIDLPIRTAGFIPRTSADGEMAFDPNTLEARTPKPSPTVQAASLTTETAEPNDTAVPPSDDSEQPIAPTTHSDEKKPGPIPWQKANIRPEELASYIEEAKDAFLEMYALYKKERESDKERAPGDNVRQIVNQTNEDGNDENNVPVKREAEVQEQSVHVQTENQEDLNLARTI